MHLNNSRNFLFCKVLLLFTLKPFFSKVLACSIICQCVFFCSETIERFWIELDVLLMTFDLLYQGESSCCLFSMYSSTCKCKAILYSSLVSALHTYPIKTKKTKIIISNLTYYCSRFDACRKKRNGKRGAGHRRKERERQTDSTWQAVDSTHQ